MASIDYTALADVAQALIEDNGRALTFVKLEETPTDVAKPWLGAAAPRNPAQASVAGFGVSVEPSAATRLGISTEDSDFIKRAQEILIVGLGSAANATDLSEFDEVIDGSTRWKINGVEKLRPASTTLVYFVSVRR